MKTIINEIEVEEIERDYPYLAIDSDGDVWFVMSADEAVLIAGSHVGLVSGFKNEIEDYKVFQGTVTLSND